MDNYTDVLVRIRGATGEVKGLASVYPVETNVRESGNWTGRAEFALDSLDLADPKKYGKDLWKQLTQSNPGMIRALDQAGLTRGSFIRLRLWLDENESTETPTIPHWVRWERLWANLGVDRYSDLRLAVHHKIAFSRYIAVERPDEAPPESTVFGLLFALSNPTGLKDSEVIEVEQEIESFLAEFEQRKGDRRLQVTLLPGRTGISPALRERVEKQGWKVVPGPTSLETLADQMTLGCHGLHILAHGDFDPSESVGRLKLENGQGGPHDIGPTELQALLTPSLQLMVFQACHSASSSAAEKPPFASLGPRMIKLGVPAVVAMQDAVTMEDARKFFSEFYRNLLDDGLVDVAVNRGRQRLVKDRDNDSWSIPVLFTRLRGGRLWNADPLREAVLNLLSEPQRDLDFCPPQQVIEHIRGLDDYDPVMGASGPCFDLESRTDELESRTDEILLTPGSMVILTGPRGANKDLFRRRIFHRVGVRFSQSQRDTPTPVLVHLCDLVGNESTPWGVLERIWRNRFRDEEKAQVKDQKFLFLINGEEDFRECSKAEAIEAIERLRKELGNCSILLIADEQLLPVLKDNLGETHNKPILLVTQPLEWAKVSTFLEKQKGEAASSLRHQIIAHGLTDLTSLPKFLRHMLRMVERDKPITSRQAVLGDYAASFLSRMNTSKIPRVCVEDALQRIAFQIQTSGKSELHASDFFAALSSARGGRDFSLGEFQTVLVDSCLFLVPTGDESFRFSYLVVQWYFAARYLQRSPDRKRLIIDVTASLGRLARVRRWERVLVLLAGMLESPRDLLGAVIAGSSLMEGEQVFLAVQCFQEAVAVNASAAADLEDVADQLADTLIWRSSWDPRRPYWDRSKSVNALVQLCVLFNDQRFLFKDRRPDVIGHLLKLTFADLSDYPSKVAVRYDWSGIRQSAASGLVLVHEAAHEYVQANCPELVEPMKLWFERDTHPEGIKDLLRKDDPKFSVIAAVALAQSPDEIQRQLLVEGYNVCKNPGVLWGIADAIAALDAAWVQEHVVEQWVQQAVSAGGKSRDARLRHQHLCYLIRKTNFASCKAREFLARCLLSGSIAEQAGALRAFGNLQDLAVESWLRELSELILSRELGKIDPSRMKADPKSLTNPMLQRSAIETLRDVGDQGSLEVLRKARTHHLNDSELTLLSFQVAEEIGWRLTGCLDYESYKPKPD
jgi:hypothetical protein